MNSGGNTNDMERSKGMHEPRLDAKSPEQTASKDG